MLRQPRRMSSLPPRPAGGRFTLAALCGLVMFSATFALASALGGEEALARTSDPLALEAEDDTRALLDERLHLHLKRLHALAGVAN